jgi:streptogramin lyase
MRMSKGLVTKGLTIAVVASAVVVVAPSSDDVAGARSFGVTEYAIGDARLSPHEIVAGPDGRIWFSENDPSAGNTDPRLAAMTTSGVLTEYPMPHDLDAMTVGPDGNLWITAGTPVSLLPNEPAMAPVIMKVSPSGSVLAELPLPPPAIPGDISDAAQGITAGPDGNLWYGRLRGRIGRLTTSGVFTEFPVPAASDGGSHFVGEITRGPDGALWFVEAVGGRIGRVTTAGAFTMYSVPGANQLSDIVTGPDGKLWFTDRAANIVGTITPQGAIDTQQVGGAEHIVVGPDGNLWVGAAQSLWRISPAGNTTEFPLGDLKNAAGVAAGPDGRLWFTQFSDDAMLDPGSVGALTLADVPTGEFTALTPARILDTRDGTGRGGATTPLGHEAQFDVQVTGRGGVPASGVSAVVLNATVTAPTAGSFLSVWPAGQPRPVVSNLNYSAGQTVPNLVTVAVGEDGKVSVFNGAGSTHVIFDVLGYYSSSTGPFGARFVPLDPVRVFDTRDGTGGVAPQPIGPGDSLPFDLTGPDLLPETGVSGVVVNVTVTEPTGNGYLTVHPDGVARPLASNLNFVPGQTVANLVTVRLSPAGVARFYNAVGTTHVIADLVGFYTDEVTTNAGRFVPLQPSRVLDTRVRGYPVGPEQIEAMQMLGAGGAPPADVSAVALNVTATQPTAAGYLSVFPHGCDVPFVSSLNFAAGQTVPNLALSAVSVADGVCSEFDGFVDVFNPVGEVHVIADLFGYFTDDSFVDHYRG